MGRGELVHGKIELRDAYVVALIFVLSAFLIQFSPYISAYDSSSTDLQANLSSEDFIEPIIYHPDAIDGDFNGIQDSLENIISQVIVNRSAVLPVVVTLYNPVFTRANSLQGSGNIEAMNERVGGSGEERPFPVRNKTLNEDIVWVYEEGV